MPADSDHYEIYYADKLWSLLPAVYRSLDSDVFNSNGPLRELVNRIGAQAATLRRSIDRLWEDQSIESCDDWVISYIGDLLATNLVASLDARGQRLDVAKTIYYRRRKGTVAVLEEIASNITGWDVRVVEFFRRLGRTRHCFDPAIVDSAAPADDHTLQLAEGLTGTWTDSKIGGWADLRNAYGASMAQSPFSVASSIRPPSAFDEYFHTADFRAGRGRSGWYNIPKLGVFLWRLMSFGVDQTTPVQNGNCYTFDPTGRDVQLFAASTRSLGDTWVSPQEWQLPTPISTPLLRSALTNVETQPIYAHLDSDGVTIQENSLGFFIKPGSFYELIDVSQVTTAPEALGASYALMVFPESGRFAQLAAVNSPITVTYHYGFSAPMGAGPYDRRIVGATPNPTPLPALNVTGGGSGIAGLMQLPTIGTVSVNDSQTYDAVAPAPDVQQLTVMAQNQTRPLIRLSPPVNAGMTEWVFTGINSGNLVLEGMFVSGGDIVLRGSFASVTLTCCTFDPGSAAKTPSTAVFAQSIDGRDLVPTRLWVEGEIQQLNIDRSILGPIRMRSGGAVESLTITNSTLQAIPTSNSDLLTPGDVKDPEGLASRLSNGHDAFSAFLYQRLSPSTKSLMAGAPAPWQLAQQLASDLNAMIQGGSLYDPSRFALFNLTAETKALLLVSLSGTQLAHLNRLLLDQAYPIEVADLTLAFDNGTVNLSRCTLMGGAYVHRLEASECILGDVATVEDFQDGCVRFSAWSTGSVIPRQYESVQIPAATALFTSQDFGQPGYAQLLDGADNEIVSGTGSIITGAQDGSEMGAFAGEKNPIKESSILLKYQEYMPLGLSPVLIHVT